MGTVAVVLVVITAAAVCVDLVRPRLSRIRVAIALAFRVGLFRPRLSRIFRSSLPKRRGREDDGPDSGAGVREPRSPKPTAGAAVAAVAPPSDIEAA